ncbi:MAG TPA: hypothetical protein VF310_06725 [Vicinamibacteria bacterium]
MHIVPSVQTVPPPAAEALGDELPLLDPRWNLVQRVAASAAFRKSRRLQDFLLFVCERALRDAECVVHEQEIGTAVFGRPADFDSSHDTLVRVQASQLRKRLQQYFSSEGSDESIVIEIPKGRYTPVFRQREPQPRVEPLRAVPPPPLEDKRLPHRGWVAGGVAAAGLGLLAACGWLLLENRELHQRLRAGLAPQPAVDQLWQQMFGQGQHTYVVLADGTYTMFQDVIQRQLTPTDYQRQRFRALADERLEDPVARGFAYRLMNRQFTSIADAGLVQKVSLLNAAHGIPTDVILARDASPGHFRSHNAILSGSRRANPWVELFEEQLNFRSRFVEEERRAYFENKSPQPGEQSSYEVRWDRLGYCRVAYLPNLDGSGSVLLLSGTDMGSSDAGAQFITSERWVRQLRGALGLRGREPLPYFEVLLRTELVLTTAGAFEMIAHRVHTAPR